MKKSIIKTILIAMLSFSSLHASAPACFNFISSIDWRHFTDSIKFRFKSCVCGQGASSKAGWSVGISEPIGVYDSVNTPWAFPCLDLKLDTRVDRPQGTSQDGGDNSGGEKNYHFVIFPVFSVMNFLQDTFCFERLDTLNIGTMSEVLPQARNDILANITDGGVNLLTANPIAQAACVVDCASSITGHPINSMFWCSGCWETPKTDSAFVSAKQPVAEAAAHVQKLTRLLHRTALMTKTSNATFAFTTDEAGSVTDSMCGERLFFERIKTQYQYNLNTPTVGKAFKTGSYPLSFAAFKNTLNSNDDFSMWLWRTRDYCAGAYKCRSTFSQLSGK